MLHAALQTYEHDADMFAIAGKVLMPFKKNNVVQNIVEGVRRQTRGTFTNLSNTIGFVNAVTGEVHPVANYYKKTIDQGIINVASGAFDIQTVVRRAIDNMSATGLTMIDFESGARRSVAAHMRTTIRTGLGQLTNRISESNLEMMNHCYVETSAHMGARPDHVNWQGQQFYWAEKDTSGDNNSANYPDFVGETGYGTGAGLGGWNCRHSFYAFFPGISEPAYSKKLLKEYEGESIEYNERTYTPYEASQRQRQLEREMRVTKRKIVGYSAIEDKEQVTVQAIRLSRQYENYTRLSKAANLRIKADRLQETGYNKSISSRSVWAKRKAEHRVAKNITVDDFDNLKTALREAFGKNVEVREDVVDAVYNALNKFDGLKLFDNVSIKRLGDKVVFQTVSTKYGSWAQNEFIINRDKIKGKTISEIDNIFEKSDITVCNSFDDGVYHEYMHALTASKMSFAQYERLCQTKGLSNISEVAAQDLAESIAELGVVNHQGKYELISEEGRELLEPILKGVKK